MLTTNEKNTFSGIWTMTKENTYYGYKEGNEYHWYKSKTTVKNHLKGTNITYFRGTFIKNEMYINLKYITIKYWK